MTGRWAAHGNMLAVHSGSHPTSLYRLRFGASLHARQQRRCSECKELAWLGEDSSLTKHPVKMVCLHHPLFDPAGADHILKGGNDQFMQMLTRQGAAYVRAGYTHSYDEAQREGLTYIITGGAGAPLYPGPNWEVFHHCFQVTVRGEKVSTEIHRLEG